MKTKVIYITELTTVTKKHDKHFPDYVYASMRKTIKCFKSFYDVINYLEKHQKDKKEYIDKYIDVYVFHLNENIFNKEDDKQITKRIQQARTKFYKGKALYNPMNDAMFIARMDKQGFILDEMLGDLDKKLLEIAFNLVETVD